MKRNSVFVCAFFIATLCMPRYAAAQSYSEEGLASWYGNEFDGRPTASGEIFNSALFTAAHPTLPFGTFLIITNKNNNRQVTVKVNDRGPFTASRIIDLSKAAAEHIDMITTGIAPVIISTLPVTTYLQPPVQPAASAAPAAPVLAAVEPPLSPLPPIESPPPAVAEPAAVAAVSAPEPAAPATEPYSNYPYPPITINVYQPSPAVPEPAPVAAPAAPAPQAAPPAAQMTPYPESPLSAPYMPLYQEAPPSSPYIPVYETYPPSQVPPQASVYSEIYSPPYTPVYPEVALPPSQFLPPLEALLPPSYVLPPAGVTPPPPTGVTLIPAITPLPNGSYKLQVGSYKTPRNAVDAFEKLKNAGLNPAYEQHGEFYRVVLAGIRGTEVQSVTDKLGRAGFREAIIREER